MQDVILYYSQKENSMEYKTCENCGNKIIKNSVRGNWKLRRYCSRKCYRIYVKENCPLKDIRLSKARRLEMSKNRKGKYLRENHSNWKGGRYLNPDGYISRLVGTRIRQLEHRFIMEQHLNRKLNPNESVHHINGIRSDNRIENLIILTKREHGSLHIKQNPIYRYWKGKKQSKESIARRIKAHLGSKHNSKWRKLYGMTKKELSKKLNIPATTLERKLRNKKYMTEVMQAKVERINLK
jgi:hypothetical protein